MQVDFSEVYKQYAKRLYLFIYSKCRNSDLAEDVVQTAFLKAILNVDSFHGTCSIYSWITKIALNVLYAEWEKPDGKNESLDKLVADGIENIAVTDQDPIEDIIQSEERAELYSRINRLDQKQQDIVNVRMQGVSFKEIGEKLNKSENWAKVNYHRAVEKLKSMK